ncbi:MAG: hypothetical protein IJY33_00310 [Oscillospiraceae bacterium]|nr:hypothetical protein [Oscillospiraceae bacterium]
MVETNNNKQPKITGAERKQRGPFKKRRAGIILTKDEVIRIKEGRKKLRREMRAMGIRDKKEFELTASSLGLYFDKNKRFALLLWLFGAKGGWLLLGLALLALAILYGMSVITNLRGHFTISMSNDLFREGFSISETRGFENPTSHLFASPADGVPCISITNIPENVDEIDGEHNDEYFAYTFYVRNEGESQQNLLWNLRINSESQQVADAAWAMLFVDGKMTVYAKPDESGQPQSLPSKSDNTRGYLSAPLYSKAADPQGQYEIVKQSGSLKYWRVNPEKFLSDSLVDSGVITAFKPQEVHKFTVVIWLEGDDPHCTNELIGGHLGMEFYMEAAQPQA